MFLATNFALNYTATPFVATSVELVVLTDRPIFNFSLKHQDIAKHIGNKKREGNEKRYMSPISQDDNEGEKVLFQSTVKGF